MKKVAPTKSVFVGWDVGGWNCEQGDSRDAIVVLDDTLKIIGTPWRGNARECIAQSKTTSGWLKALFEYCQVDFPAERTRATMAIDTPLGFPSEFLLLATSREIKEPDKTSGLNHYLFRQTERLLFDPETRRGPLSAVRDMIGSQATKGMHALGKFAPHVESCGVWSDSHDFTAIETYPAACRNSKSVQQLKKQKLNNQDKDDAYVCAIVAYLFANKPNLMVPPGDAVPRQEGWIWLPRTD